MMTAEFVMVITVHVQIVLERPMAVPTRMNAARVMMTVLMIVLRIVLVYGGALR